MSVIVQRTCTEVLTSTEARRREPTTGPLELFSSAPAYVLLGDPGSGKSTTFSTEADFPGTESVLISARDFLASDVHSHPEWRDKTLFIDGLDEMRVGSGDRRGALDSIRRSLDALGPPAFRISCREADWLGDNDRDKLAMVSPDAGVRVLRLDPLTDADVAQILEANPDVDDVHGFASEARERGVDALLSNPLTLNMLAAAVGENGVWPQSRLETFEMACLQMVRERNREHSLGDPSPPAELLLDAAGRLCAYQLLSGAAGWSPVYDDTDADFISLSDLEPSSLAVANHALSSRLFTGLGVADGRVTTVHRQIAEFLSARYLAGRIEDGLPAGRAVQLITAGDGMVVTVFRGLSAWLAALCPKARRDLINRDPVGVGLYGDLRGFSVDDKRRLLASLNREVSDYGINVAAFAPLATPDMESAIRDLLRDARRDRDHQAATDLILRALRYGVPLAGLTTELIEVIHDDTWLPHVTKAALDAFIHTTAESENGPTGLRQILSDIDSERIGDPDNELLASLLFALYPREIPPQEIWRYLTTKGNPDLFGAYFAFWEFRLLERSSDQHIAELLDGLTALMPDLRDAFRMHHADDVPCKLLVRALNKQGAEQELIRLYNWLSAAAYPSWDPPELGLARGSSGEIRAWLERRPDLQKAVLLEGLIRCPDDDDFELNADEAWDRLHGSALPNDFGLWCLDTAVASVDTHSRVADHLLRHAFNHCGQEATGQGLTRELMRKRVRGHERLERRLTELLTPRPGPPGARRPRTTDTVRTEADRRREQWVDLLRTHADDLRNNAAPQRLLFEIGMAYFGHSPYFATTTPSKRNLSGILADDDLADAVIAGLRGTVRREDIPHVDEIIHLAARSQFHVLGPPFLAGMDEMDRAEPDELEGLSALRMQQALALYYCTPTGRTTDPRWYLRWLNLRPELVADVLVQCAVPAIRGGNEYVPELYQLVRQKSHSRVAAYATPRLLASFPLRCSLHQLETLDELLWAALQHADRPTLQALLEEKISCRSMNLTQRIHWMAAGVVMAPETYLEPLESLVKGRDDRIRKMAAFFAPDERLSFFVKGLDARTLQSLINLMGRTFDPMGRTFDPMGRTFDPVESAVLVTPEMRASEQVDRLIRRLASLSSDDAALALDALVDDDALSKWRVMLERVRDQQRVIHRDASYQHPTVDQVRETLSNKAPANAVDLAALLVHSLETLAERIHTSDIDVWKQYWNTGGAYGRPESPRIEADCRDTLLFHLRGVLPIGVIARPEVEYPNDRRADIGVSYGGFNVPVEIKRDRDPRLWSALHDQLIAQYTIDPETGGHGVYLVFWFGDGKIPAPPQGRRPTSSAELQQRLEEQLTESERRRIAVRVMDVSPTNKGRST